MKKKNFIFLLFLVVLCLLGITCINSVKLNALTNVPTNSFIGHKEILPFYSDENEYIEYGLAYNSYNQTNYFIGTYYNTNQGFSYPNNAYYFWLYNFDLINSGGGDTPPVEDVQTFYLLLNSEIEASFDFVVGTTWSEWVETDYNTNDIITYDEEEGAFYYNSDYIILDITPTSLILNQDYVVELVEDDSPQFINSLIVYWGNSTSSSQIVFNFPNELINIFYSSNTFANLGISMSGYDIDFITATTQQFRLYVSASGVPTIGYRGDNWNYRPTVKDSSLNNATGASLLNETLFAPYSWASDDSGIEGPSASINYKQKDNNIMTLSSIISIANNEFTNDELISYFKTCINWDFSILQRVITGTATLYLNVNGLWFSCNYNPSALNDNDMYLNITYNPSLPTSTKDNYNYGIGELTPYVLNAYNNYELRNNVEEELKEQQAYYESLLEQEKQNALNQGYLEGESYGYNQGYNAGYNTGYTQGIQEGTDGEFTLRTLLGTIFTFPISVIKEGMDVELWGINVGGLIMFILCIGFVYVVIKLVLKFFGR